MFAVHRKEHFFMKNRDNDLSRIKHQLIERKKRGQKEVIWSLKKEQKYYIENVLHFQVKPQKYGITTKKLENYSATKSHLLKEIHHAYKSGKREIVKELSEKQVEFLRERGYKVRVSKYLINLS